MSTLTPEQQRLMALAAVFQAATMADQVARQGSVDSATMETLLHGVVSMGSNQFDQVYPRLDHLTEGHRLLRLSLSRSQTRATARPLTYAIGLLHLSGQLRRNSGKISLLQERLATLDSQRAHFDSLSSTAFCHRLAGIYVETLGSFRFRIQVHGDPALLQDDNNAAQIRALFLGGVRAAFLWHQLGGRRWQLLLQRKRHYNILNSIEINPLH